MKRPFTPLYSPALRMKAGELEGVRQLAADVADCVLPRFIIPPSSERDENTPLLLDLNRTPDISPPLARTWCRRPALIDSSYILDEFGRSRAEEWLPAMFERSRKKEVHAIPAALLGDINGCKDAFRASISRDDPAKFGIVVPSDEMVGPEFHAAMAEALKSLDLTAADCVVIADFGGAEFTEPSVVAPVIDFSLETLQNMGLWRQIIFQGSNYPEKNPAPKDGGVEFWPRNEWLAWRLAVKFDPMTAEHMIFGDYAADCAKMKFGSNHAPPIPHLRYTTGTNWRVQRGPKNGKRSDRIHHVYAEIVSSNDFSGAGFSPADRYIAAAAANRNAPHGDAAIWRRLNTTHHITQVVNDIALVRGVGIKRLEIVESFQMPLIPQT